MSLTSVVCKTLERIIREKIEDHAEKYKLISSDQHGFVKRKSCTSNLIETQDLLTEIADKKRNADVVFLDFEKG